MSGRGLIILGFALTVLFVGFCYALAVQPHCIVVEEVSNCVSNYDRFLSSPPNEKGDTLAGLAGSLAFLWIIVTVLLQGKELSLQRKELEKMRETQEQQTNMLVQENERQSALAKDAKIRAMVHILKSTMDSMVFSEFQFEPNVSASGYVHPIKFAPSPAIDSALDSSAREWANHIQRIHKAVKLYCEDNDCYVSKPDRPTPWLACLTQASSIVGEAGSGASEATLEWVYYDLKLPWFERVLGEALEDDVLWRFGGERDK